MVMRIACHRRIPVSMTTLVHGIWTNRKIGFNQIDLPQYSSYEMLRQQLLLAINEGGEGFGFA